MSIKSPYLEVGLTRRESFANTQPKKEKAMRFGFSGTNDKKLRRDGHEWNLDLSPKKWAAQKYGLLEKSICRNCKKPKFAVYGKPCRGRK